MKRLLVAVAVCSLFASCAPVLAQELPFGVTPKEITVTGTVDADGAMFGYSKGRLIDSYEYKVGNRTGVKLESVSYELHFWNVGKLGGTSGYLFWKKDFSKASLHLYYNIGSNGQLITDVVDNSKIGLPDGFKMEDAESEPDVKPISCSLQFSGGPAGTFTGTCGNGAKIQGRVAGAGAFVIFDDIKQPAEINETEYALGAILSKDLRMNGEFGDWKFDESTLEDSGARFSSIQGEVDVRHEKDTKWEYPKLGTVLYTLDHVKTSEESQAIIGFADLSTFLVKAESEVVITTPPKKDSKIGLVYGNIKANVKKMMKDGTMEVEMSQAVAGIKGTRFELSETGTSSTIKVTEGLVSFRSKADGSEAKVAAGESVTATAAGLSPKTTFDAATADAELIAETSGPTPPIETAAPKSGRTTTSGVQTSSIRITLYAIVAVALVVGGWWLLQRKKRFRA